MYRTGGKLTFLICCTENLNRYVCEKEKSNNWGKHREN